MSPLPPGWELRRLDDIAEVRLGRQRSPKNHSGTQMRPYLRAANVDWTGLKLSDVKQMNFTDDEMVIYRLQPGDIVLSEASGSPGEVGKPGLWTGEIHDCAFQNTLIRVRSRGPEPRYLLHYFRHLARSRAFADESRGVGIHHIGRAKLAAWQIPVPPANEQRRIVDILEDHLSRLDAAHRLALAAGHRTEALDRSTLLEAVTGRFLHRVAEKPSSTYAGRQLPEGWRWAAWGEIGRSQNGRAFPSKDYQNRGVRLVRPGNLSADGSMSWTPKNTRCLPDAYRDANPTMRIGPGELVMNLTAQSLKDDFLGRVRMTGPNEDALLNQRLARLTPESITARFAYYVFRSPLFRDFVSTLNTGSLIQHMFRKQIDDFLLPVPPVAAQVRIATHLDEVLEGSSRTRRSCVDVRERGSTLRRALLVGAFLGQLTRQGADADWQAEVAGV